MAANAVPNPVETEPRSELARDLHSVDLPAITKARQAVRATDGTIRRYPYAAIGAVAAATAILGWLVARR